MTAPDLPPLPPGMRRLVDEVREAEPSIDWARVERAVFHNDPASHRAEQLRFRRRRELARWGTLTLAAAAAAALLLLRRPVKQGEVVHVATASSTDDSALRWGARPVAVGDVVAVDSSEWLEARGRLRVRLMPKSTVRIVELGQRTRFELLGGGLFAAVVPVKDGEPFAVDVHGQRVAVHGTRFSVILRDRTFDVAVAEGLVVVGAPNGDERTTGMEVPHGSRASFPFDAGFVAKPTQLNPSDNGRIEAMLRGDAVEPQPSTTASSSGALAPRVSISPRIDSSAKGAASELPLAQSSGLTDAQLAGGIERIRRELVGCAPPTTRGVTFTLESAMTLEVDPTGTIRSLTFDPPLDPKLRECLRTHTDDLRFPNAPVATRSVYPIRIAR